MRQARDRSGPADGTALVGVVPPPTSPTVGESLREFNEKFRRLHGPLISYAERLLDRESARDAVSQTFLEFWRRWPQLTPEQRSDKYFFGAVRHTAADALAAMRGFVSLEDAEEELERKVVSEASPAWRGDTPADVLDAAIAAMPAARREVFLLAKEQGLTYMEVAEQLGLKIGTINTQMLRAYADIRAAFARAHIKLPTARPPRLPSATGGANND